MTLPSTLPAALATTLAGRPRRWLVTGAAGFIGSHLVEVLLHAGQHVVGLDNYSTGHRRNTDEVLAALPAQAHARLVFIEGDIRDPDTCARACEGVDAVLHQAALGSVPRSIKDPATSTCSARARTLKAPMPR